MQNSPSLLGNTPPARRFVILPILAVVLLTLVFTGDVRASSGWELTVYYTPVESYHGGTPTKVYGCPTIDCVSSLATQYLGTFPSDFLAKVQQEGTGKTTDGQDASTPYLNWTNNGNGYYWLDTDPRAASGAPLVAWQTSAASSEYPYGTTWQVTSCGVNSGDHTAVDPTMCQKVKASTWVVQDRFEGGFSTTNHADLYVGLEDQPNYENTAPQYFDWVSAATTLGGSSTTPPQVTSVSPQPGATGVQRNTNVIANFSAAMDSKTINTQTLKLYKVRSDGSTKHITNVTVSCNSSSNCTAATLNPYGTSSTLLAAKTQYKVVVTTGATDLAGNALDQDFTTSGNQQEKWSFTTGST